MALQIWHGKLDIRDIGFQSFDYFAANKPELVDSLVVSAVRGRETHGDKVTRKARITPSRLTCAREKTSAVRQLGAVESKAGSLEGKGPSVKKCGYYPETKLFLRQ